MNEHERSILKRIRGYAIQAIHFKENMDLNEFSNDAKTISACVFNLSQIGELVSRLDNVFIENHKNIPWRKIKGMRNKIIHDYEGVLITIVWDVLEDFLPELIADIDELIS